MNAPHFWLPTSFLIRALSVSEELLPMWFREETSIQTSQFGSLCQESFFVAFTDYYVSLLIHGSEDLKSLRRRTPA